MKYFSWIVGLFISIFIFSACKTRQQIQQSPPPEAQEESSLLWQIDGDSIKRSFLFGTIHMIDKEEYFFTKEMDSALVTTEQLALEIDLESAMNLGTQIGLIQKALMQNDTTIKDLVSEKEYQMIKDHFQEIGIPFFFLERVKPMFLTIFSSDELFSGGGLNMDEIKSYELELVQKAKAEKIPVAGLETVEYQMSIFDSIPYGAQADMLVASISDESEEGAAQIDTLVYYYKKQNLKKLDELLNSDPTTSNYREILLDNRNRNWIPMMSAMMKKDPVFFAVGAGHLSGEFGVINLLRKKGYKVTPIKLSIDP